MATEFVFTPDNIIENIEKLGAWSAYGLASSALKHYFPDEYDENDFCEVDKEIELMRSLGCESWQDVIKKYSSEIGYEYPFNPDAVNER